LGKIRLERIGEHLRISLWEDPFLHRGASFCAEKPGAYQFAGYSINIDENNALETVPSTSVYCDLPVIFRTPMMGEKINDQNYQKMKTKDTNNSIIAEDKNGKIAVICLNQNKILISMCKERKSIGKNTFSVEKTIFTS
jgi:hypothetical protein